MKVFWIFVLSLLIFSCVRNKNFKNNTVETPQVQQDMGSTPSSNHIVKVKEVIQGSAYTYVLVSENGQENWLAASKLEIEVGEECQYGEALKMENFNSKELDKTFDVIYFVSQLNKGVAIKSSQSAKGHMGKAPSKENKGVKLEKTEGELTIADIFKNKDSYSGKKVKITGVMVKINKTIMGRNWLHLQDGTKHEEEFDLTITSQEIANIGATITVEGIITLNKDFGAGYSYDVIMEDATITDSGKEI